MTRNGIAHPEVVDLVAVDADGDPLLVVVEDEPLTAEHDAALRRKLEVYVAYAIDGQLATDCPEVAGRPVTIRLVLAAPPDEHIGALLERFTAGAAREGLTVDVVAGSTDA